jgi:YVTN family beta-propeller protein
MQARRFGWWLVAIHAGLMAWAGSAAAAKVYVADEGDDTVSVVDTATFKRIGRITVGRGPHNVQVSPDGRFAWVTNNGEKPAERDEGHGMPKGEHEAMAGSGEVWAIDTATDAVIAKVPVGSHPAHVVLTPDGRFAYVTNGGQNTVTVIDTDAKRAVATVAVGAYPHGARVSPDGRQAYVADLKGGTVSVIDTQTHQPVAKIEVGKGPAQVGFTPHGRLAFVSLSEENSVAVIDPRAQKVLRKLAVGTVPIQLYVTPDSRTLVVANQGTRKKPGKTVSLIDIVSFKTLKTIETGAGAHGVAIDREGRFAYVTNIYANTLSVLDLKDRKVVANVPVGKEPNGVSLAP